MDDDLMRIWEATETSTVCTCPLCRNLGVDELVHEYDWEYAEWSHKRPDWMHHPDGMAHLYAERKRLQKLEEEREIRRNRWLSRKGFWRRVWNWIQVNDAI